MAPQRPIERAPQRPAERSLELAATMASLADVRRFAEAAAAGCGLSPSETHAVVSACSEAAANAIEHGSRPGGRIRLRAAVEGDSLALYVSDAGRFVPRVSPRGTMPERGRGLAFMAELMDEVQVRPRPDGTDVRLSKRIAS